jgi:hypothetical protein
MKRFAILILLAAVSRSSAVDLPLPTGYAPTSPSVPAPSLRGGLPVEHASFRDKLGIGAVEMADASCGPRGCGRSLSWRPFQNSALFQTPTWCDNCAPVVKRPLPPLPAGLSSGQCATPAPAAKHDGSCCEKLKNWLCFHYTPVKMPLIPTQKTPALYTYFPTVEGPGYGAGCADGKCGGHSRIGSAAKACVSCPAPGEALLPGYRLANPEK